MVTIFFLFHGTENFMHLLIDESLSLTKLLTVSPQPEGSVSHPAMSQVGMGVEIQFQIRLLKDLFC